VRVLAADGSTMSNRFWDTGVPKAIKERRYTRTKAPALVFEEDSTLQLVVFRPLVSAEVIKETQI